VEGGWITHSNKWTDSSVCVLHSVSSLSSCSYGQSVQLIVMYYVPRSYVVGHR
jgi:hypothetical protein